MPLSLPLPTRGTLSQGCARYSPTGSADCRPRPHAWTPGLQHGRAASGSGGQRAGARSTGHCSRSLWGRVAWWPCRQLLEGGFRGPGDQRAGARGGADRTLHLPPSPHTPLALARTSHRTSVGEGAEPWEREAAGSWARSQALAVPRGAEPGPDRSDQPQGDTGPCWGRGHPTRQDSGRAFLGTCDAPSVPTLRPGFWVGPLLSV